LKDANQGTGGERFTDGVDLGELVAATKDVEKLSPEQQEMLEDAEQNFGFTWTAEGTETLYHRSRAVIACKAAGKRFPIGGMWQEVHDLEGLRKQALFNKQLGFSGEIILHPSNVAVINEVYSPAAGQLDFYRGMIEAFAAAEKEGQGAIMYRGEHIDIAHVETARSFLALWDH